MGSKRGKQSEIGEPEQPVKKMREENMDLVFCSGINEMAEAVEQPRQSQ